MTLHTHHTTPGLSEQREGGRAASDARAPRDATHNWQRTTKQGLARARVLHTRLTRVNVASRLRVSRSARTPHDGSPLIVWIPTPCGRSHAGARQRFSVRRRLKNTATKASKGAAASASVSETSGESANTLGIDDAGV